LKEDVKLGSVDKHFWIWASLFKITQAALDVKLTII
jgi:hypothetical protein